MKDMKYVMCTKGQNQSEPRLPAIRHFQYVVPPQLPRPSPTCQATGRDPATRRRAPSAAARCRRAPRCSPRTAEGSAPVASCGTTSSSPRPPGGWDTSKATRDRGLERGTAWACGPRKGLPPGDQELRSLSEGLEVSNQPPCGHARGSDAATPEEIATFYGPRPQN